MRSTVRGVLDGGMIPGYWFGDLRSRGTIRRSSRRRLSRRPRGEQDGLFNLLITPILN